MAAPRYLLRRGTPGDADALAAIERAVFDDRRYGGMVMEPRALRAHAANANILLVAEDPAEPGVPVGHAVGFVRRGSPYVRFYSFAVRPDRQGGGAGSVLLDGLEEAARAGGYRGIRLEVRADNPLRKHYARRGYAEVATWPGYYPDGTAAIRMVKQLG